MNNLEKNILNSKIEKPETKEDLQIKKLKLQIEQLEEKKKAQAQKEKTSKLKNFSTTCGTLLKIILVLLAPLFIIGGFLVACAGASGGSRHRRR